MSGDAGVVRAGAVVACAAAAMLLGSLAVVAAALVPAEAPSSGRAPWLVLLTLLALGSQALVARAAGFRAGLALGLGFTATAGAWLVATLGPEASGAGAPARAVTRVLGASWGLVALAGLAALAWSGRHAAARAAALVTWRFAGVSWLAVACVLGLGACSPATPESVVEAGRRSYVVSCAPCHGLEGDGAGPSAAGMVPPPRDLRQGLYKYGWVTEGLPRDEDLERILRRGLHGTAMAGWELGPVEAEAVVQYLKTLAPDAWSDAGPGVAVQPPPDPWRGRAEAAVARGRELYHGAAQCWSCHPAHAPREEVARLHGDASVRGDLHEGVPRESDYLLEGRRIWIVPPDFTLVPLRSVRAGSEAEDLFRVIAAGIPGTAMPAWQGALPDADLWALAHYVASLAALRGTPEAAALRAGLLAPASGATP